MAQQFAIQLNDIQQAATQITDHVVRTPCLFNERLAAKLGCRLSLKLESLQHVGAFKARGATNAVLGLSSQQAEQGVVTHSSGNHAAALARAASIRGIAAHIVMPSNSAQNKIAAVRSYGVEPTFCEPSAASRAQVAADVQSRTGATLVHPYDNPAVMAGQGTVALEILEQLPEVTTILVPVGGGGLLSGVLTCIKSLRPDVQVIAVEPELADDAYRGWRAGSLQMPTRYDTIADGLRSPLGELTFPVIHTLVDDFILVSESAIGRAMRLAAETARVVVEPSGAVGLAAVLSDPARFVDATTVAVVTGGNLDLGNCHLGGESTSKQES